MKLLTIIICAALVGKIMVKLMEIIKLKKKKTTLKKEQTQIEFDYNIWKHNEHHKL